MRKGFLEYFILLIISNKPAYVPDIIAELKAVKLIVVEGTLYPLLIRLKNAGLFNYQWEESSMGPPRKYYEMTPKGREALTEIEKAWEEVSRALYEIKGRKTL